MADHLDGRLTRITYRSPDNDFLIARLATEEGESIPVLGPSGAPHPLAEGVCYRLHGEWVTHDEHGRQFRYALATPLTHDRRGVVEYLKNHAPHVGEKKARQLWDHFGGEAVQVLREQPGQVVALGILTEEQAGQAAQSLHNAGAWQDTRIDLTGLLAGRGFQLDRVISGAIRRWRRRAPQVIRGNPYRLLVARLPSCGWARVDKLAMDLGYPATNIKRQALALAHALRTQSEGHTWVTAEDAERRLSRLVRDADFRRAARLAERARLVVIRRSGAGRWLAPWAWANDEQYIATKVKEMQAWTPSRPGRGRGQASTSTSSATAWN